MSSEKNLLIQKCRKVIEDMVVHPLNELKTDVSYLRREVAEFKTSVRECFESIDRRFDAIDLRFDRLETASESPSALDMYKQVQELREWKIRTEAREAVQRAS